MVQADLIVKADLVEIVIVTAEETVAVTVVQGIKNK